MKNQYPTSRRFASGLMAFALVASQTAAAEALSEWSSREAILTHWDTQDDSTALGTFAGSTFCVAVVEKDGRYVEVWSHDNYMPSSDGCVMYDMYGYLVRGAITTGVDDGIPSIIIN